MHGHDRRVRLDYQFFIKPIAVFIYFTYVADKRIYTFAYIYIYVFKEIK